mmetsp:Transcript_29894/g.82071  ORF Transcript_29894/g.82071 Transcript_29894/m.82071 type:complete len:202 (+) Transcript_29894:350-955(+)
MSGAKAKVLRLALATVAALPTQELSAMLGALKLPLGCATTAHELHRKHCLHVLIEVMLLVVLAAAALHLATVVGLAALRALVEGHLLHRKHRDSVLVAWVVCLWAGTTLLHDPALECLPSDLLVHSQPGRDEGVDGWVLHDDLAERALDAFEDEPASACLALAEHSFGTVVMKKVAAPKTYCGSGANRLRPTNRAPLVEFW